MILTTGRRLGPYEIVSRIGAGGMGEVFRARDTRLDRTVAVKTLPADLAANEQMRLRLHREAKAISALSHPNICALYDVGEQDGVHYLVMEHLEGETLADRLERGPLPLREALRHGIEICNALDRAHRAGVIHRDLKPGNIMLTKSGAKLLDFGLAKAVEDNVVSAEAPTMHAPRHPLTAEGTIVGTFQYMSPEQLEAAPVDPRTDIFALGAVLYEMVTGQRAFAGKTRTSLIAAIVASSPRPMSELQPVTPNALEHVVARCLEKDPDERWQSAHDVRLELEYIVRGLDATTARPRRNVLPWAIAALAALIAIAAGFLAFRNARATKPAQAVNAQILAPPGKTIERAIDSLSISPDARYITFRIRNDDRLWLRPLGTNEAKPIEGTRNALLPFWSPDSKWIGFVSDGKLMKVNIAGGLPVTLCDAAKGRPGAWNEDGVILFSPSSVEPLYRVPAAGGTPQPLTKLAAGESTHRWPTFLPDGKHFLYLAATHNDVGTAEGSIYVTSLEKPEERTLVVRARTNVAYARGHLIYGKGTHLLAHPFDLRTRKVTGEPFPIATGVHPDLGYFRSAFAIADDGTAVYRPAHRPEEAVVVRQIPPAAPVEIMKPGLDIAELILSPDGRKAALRTTDRSTGQHDLWVLDIERKSKQRLTSTPRESEWTGVWSADSTRLAFVRTHGFAVGDQLLIKTLDGSAADRAILESIDRSIVPTDWSDDGRYIAYRLMEAGKDLTGDLFVLPLEPGAKPIPIATTAAPECCASFSPDGRWLVYIAEESGKREAYATRFPPAGTEPISLGINAYVEWGAGNELIIGSGDDITLAPVTMSGNMLTVGTARPFGTFPENTVAGHTNGKSVVYTTLTPTAYDQSLTLLTDW